MVGKEGQGGERKKDRGGRKEKKGWETEEKERT